MDTLRGGRDGWDGRGGGRGRDEWRPPSEVRNIVRDSTIEYLVQAGWIQGDLVVNLPPAREPVDTAAEELARSVRAQWSAEVAAWELGDIEGPLAVCWLARWGATAPAAGTAEPPYGPRAATGSATSRTPCSAWTPDASSSSAAQAPASRPCSP